MWEIRTKNDTLKQISQEKGTRHVKYKREGKQRKHNNNRGTNNRKI